jgi:hypothetical protein
VKLGRPGWALAIAAVLLTGCGGGSASAHRLGVPGDPKTGLGATAAIPNIRMGTTYVAYVGSVCLKSGEPIEPSSVEVVKLEGSMKILDWAIRNGPAAGADVGIAPGKISSRPGFSRQPVTGSCSGTDVPSQLDVELQIGSATAVSQGFRVNYKDGKKSGHVISPFTLTLCNTTCPTGTS